MLALHVGEVESACREQTAEIAATLTQLLGQTITLQQQPAVTQKPEITGSGIGLLFTVGQIGVSVLLSGASGLVPQGLATGGAENERRRTQFAKDMGERLFPSHRRPTQSTAACLNDLNLFLTRGKLAQEASLIPFEMRAADGRRGRLLMAWPLEDAAGALAALQPPTAASELPNSTAWEVMKSVAPEKPLQLDITAEYLPDYSRSLLHIRVPVTVTLAASKQPISRIIELGPGSILQFSKSCEEMLDLDVGGQLVAKGEAVKVGDKFGLRVVSIVLPEERFVPAS